MISFRPAEAAASISRRLSAQAAQEKIRMAMSPRPATRREIVAWGRMEIRAGRWDGTARMLTHRWREARRLGPRHTGFGDPMFVVQRAKS